MTSSSWPSTTTGRRAAAGSPATGNTSGPVVYNAQVPITQLLIQWVTDHKNVDPAVFSTQDWRLVSGGQPITITPDAAPAVAKAGPAFVPMNQLVLRRGALILGPRPARTDRGPGLLRRVAGGGVESASCGTL